MLFVRLLALLVLVLMLFWWLWRQKNGTAALRRDAAPHEDNVGDGSTIQEEREATIEDTVYSGKTSYRKINPLAEPSLFAKAHRQFVALEIIPASNTGRQKPAEINAVRYVNGMPEDTFHSLIRAADQGDGVSTGSIGADTATEQNSAFINLWAFVGEDLIATYNAPATARLLVPACNQAGIDRHFLCFDTLSMARVLYPQLADYSLPKVMETVAGKEESNAQGIGAILNGFIDRYGGSFASSDTRMS